MRKCRIKCTYISSILVSVAFCYMISIFTYINRTLIIFTQTLKKVRVNPLFVFVKNIDPACDVNQHVCLFALCLKYVYLVCKDFSIHLHLHVCSSLRHIAHIHKTTYSFDKVLHFNIHLHINHILIKIRLFSCV